MFTVIVVPADSDKWVHLYNADTDEPALHFPEPVTRKAYAAIQRSKREGRAKFGFRHATEERLEHIRRGGAALDPKLERIFWSTMGHVQNDERRALNSMIKDYRAIAKEIGEDEGEVLRFLKFIRGDPDVKVFVRRGR